MNKFTYRIYYEYNSPSHSDPSKDPQAISEALSNFPNELCNNLSDQDATVT
jgi:hypothetical protein